MSASSFAFSGIADPRLATSLSSIQREFHQHHDHGQYCHIDLQSAAEVQQWQHALHTPNLFQTPTLYILSLTKAIAKTNSLECLIQALTVPHTDWIVLDATAITPLSAPLKTLLSRCHQYTHFWPIQNRELLLWFKKSCQQAGLTVAKDVEAQFPTLIGEHIDIAYEILQQAQWQRLSCIELPWLSSWLPNELDHSIEQWLEYLIAGEIWTCRSALHTPMLPPPLWTWHVSRLTRSAIEWHKNPHAKSPLPKRLASLLPRSPLSVAQWQDLALACTHWDRWSKSLETTDFWFQVRHSLLELIP